MAEIRRPLMKWQAFAIVLFAAGADAQPNQAMRDAAHNLEVIMHEQADTLNGFLMRTLAEDPAGRAQLTEMVSRSIETAKAHAADAIHIQTGRECESPVSYRLVKGEPNVAIVSCSDGRGFRIDKGQVSPR
jgi:hypothetical protein